MGIPRARGPWAGGRSVKEWKDYCGKRRVVTSTGTGIEHGHRLRLRLRLRLRAVERYRTKHQVARTRTRNYTRTAL